jgi:hypothetical protein
MAPDDAAALAARIADIQASIDGGDLAAADAALTALLAGARTPSILATAGYVKSRLGAFAGAADLCAEAERMGLASWSNAFILGTSLRDLGRWEVARQALEGAHRMAPQRTRPCGGSRSRPSRRIPGASAWRPTACSPDQRLSGTANRTVSLL